MGIVRVGKRWRVRWTDEVGRERRHWMPAGSSKDDAERYLRGVKQRVDNVKEGLEPRERNPDGLSVADVAKRLIKGKTDKSMLLRVRKYIIAGELADDRVERVTPARVRAFLDGLRPVAEGKERLAPQTVNHVRAHLVALFALAIERGWLLGTNPARAVKKRRVEQRALVTLSVDEVRRVLQAAKQPWAGIVACALCGLRKGEIYGLDVADVDVDRWELRVHRSHSKETTKSGRARVVPVHPALRPFIARAIQESHGAALFPSRVKKRRRRHPGGGADSRRLAELLAAAGITRKLRFHDLRHTAATLMLQAGVPLAHVSRILGHSGIAITVDRYGHLVTDDLRAAIERVPLSIPLQEAS